MTTPLYTNGRNVCQPGFNGQAFASSVPGQLRTIKDVFLSIIYTLRPEQKEKEETISSFVDRGVDLMMSILILLEAVEDMPHMSTLSLRQVLEDIRIKTEDQWNSYPCFVDALKTVSSIKNRILDHQIVSMLDNLQTSSSSIILQAKDEPLKDIHNNTSSNFLSGANNFTMNNSHFIHVSGDLVTKQPKDRNNNAQISGLTQYKDIDLEKEIYNGGEYRFHRGVARGRAVIVKIFQGLRAKALCVRAAEFNRSMMHSNTLRMIGGPDPNSGSSFLVFAGDFEGTAESQLAMALKKGTKEGCIVGFNTIIACALGLDYLRSKGISFPSVKLSDFVLLVSKQGKIVLSFDAEVSRDATNDVIDFEGQLGVVQQDKSIEIFNELIRTTFYTTCKNYYREQRLYADETDDGFEVDELEDETERQLSEPDQDTQGHKSATQKTPRKRKGHRLELVWKFQSANFASLGEIGRKYQDSLANFHSENILVHRQGHSTSQVFHRCMGYKRTEIVLTPDIERSGIVSHTSPVPNEICSVCGQDVGTTEILDCVCGVVSNNVLTNTPTIKCTVCSRWQHQRCMEISTDVQMQTYVCWQCPGSKVTATVVSPSITTKSPIIQTSDIVLTPIAQEQLHQQRLLEQQPQYQQLQQKLHQQLEQQIQQQQLKQQQQQPARPQHQPYHVHAGHPSLVDMQLPPHSHARYDVQYPPQQQHATTAHWQPPGPPPPLAGRSEHAHHHPRQPPPQSSGHYAPPPMYGNGQPYHGAPPNMGGLADLGLASRNSRLDERWGSFMADSGLLDDFGPRR